MTSVLDMVDGPDPEWAERQIRKGLIAAKAAFIQITDGFVTEARTARELSARCAMAGDQFRTAATTYVPRFHPNPVGALQAEVIADWLVSHLGEAFDVNTTPSGQLSVTCPKCHATTSGTINQISDFIDEHRKGCPTAAEKSARRVGAKPAKAAGTTHVNDAGETICHCGANLGDSDHCPVCGCEEFEAECDVQAGESPEEDIEFVPGREPGKESSLLLVSESLRCTACNQMWREDVPIDATHPVVYCPHCGSAGLVPRSADRLLPADMPLQSGIPAESLQEYLAHWLWQNGRVNGQGGLVLDQHAAGRWRDNQSLVAALVDKTGMTSDEVYSKLVRDVYIMEAGR